jgi:hypothetical protein
VLGSQAWETIIPALGRLRQERKEYCEFMVSLHYIVRLCLKNKIKNILEM